MAFNLITSPWLEVRRASGVRSVVRPCDLTGGPADDPVVALDFPRPDWNAAVTEFLIGLSFLTMAPEDAVAWGERYRNRPTPDDLTAAFEPLVRWFDLDGEGPCAFQDFDRLDNAECKPLSGLLIDAPGENTVKNNADLFVKRNDLVLSLAHGAAALITLQTYAPAGGAGHRTSLRGGGPLTTLLVPPRSGGTTLWDIIWANTPDRQDQIPLDPALALPWTAATLTSASSTGVVRPEGRHPALAFFACPRRIRLVLKHGSVVGWRTLNYGANYLNWLHPLSPYREDKKSGMLPLHPNAGSSDYGDWLAWWGFNGITAESLRLWNERRDEISERGSARIQAFGYDMDNMKARQWLDARLPWVSDAVHGGELKQAVQRLIGGSDAAARALRMAVKIAVHGQRTDTGYRLPDTLPMDAMPEAADRLWQETQAPFEALLNKVIERLTGGAARTDDLLRAWFAELRRRALGLFDEMMDLDGLTDVDPRRLLYARGQLFFALADRPKAPVLKALGLEPSPSAAKPEKEVLT